ncbi:MAG: SDR family NAD(P)-dependent oxidoreductase [Limnohabitans sp.]
MNGKHVLVTGGTGTVGSALVAHLLNRYPGLARITVFSNSEQEQYEMSMRLPASKYPLRYVMGDVRDRERVMQACRGVDVLVHAAAMKHVPVSEANPIECAQTNIMGSQNVIDAALSNGIGKVIALSTDKAVSPINVYGASKLFLERLFLNADTLGDTRFTVVRYANVFGSKGSVVPFFLKQKKQGFLPITDPAMTRFSITMEEGLNLIIEAIEKGWGGEILVPLAPSYRIMDVAEALAPGTETRMVGIRPGEKIHEIMLGEAESGRVLKHGNRYVVYPELGRWNAEAYCLATGATRMTREFMYSSGANTNWLTVGEIQALVAHL